MDPSSLMFSTYGLCALLALLCMLLFYFRCIYKPLQYFKKQGIPGPSPLPLMGNLGLMRQFKGDFFQLMQHLSKTYGPNSGFFFATRATLFTSDLDVIRDVMIKQFDKFINRRTSGLDLVVEGKEYKGISSTAGDEWRRRRHIITPAFSGHKLRLMEPVMMESMERLVSKIEAYKNEDIEIFDLYRKLVMEVVLSAAFGRSLDVQGGNGGLLYDSAVGVIAGSLEGGSTLFKTLRILQVAVPFLNPVLNPLIRRQPMFRHVDALISAAVKMIRLRKEAEGQEVRKDLLQMMVDATDDETNTGLSTGEIVADSVGFMLAGYATTSITLTLATYLLASNPDVQEKLGNEIEKYFEEHPDSSQYDAASEINYLDMVICETLRLYPPGFLTARVCNGACDIKGIHFEPGTLVLAMISEIHRNPDNYPDPMKFNPDRFTPEEKANRHPCAFLPFGLGPRNCVGMRLALMQAKLALIQVLRKFTLQLSSQTKLPLEFEQGFLPKSKIYAVFSPR